MIFRYFRVPVLKDAHLGLMVSPNHCETDYSPRTTPVRAFRRQGQMMIMEEIKKGTLGQQRRHTLFPKNTAFFEPSRPRANPYKDIQSYMHTYKINSNERCRCG